MSGVTLEEDAACPVHGARCGPPRPVFDLASPEAVTSPWGVRTTELRIFACRRTGLRFRPAPPEARIADYYGADYHEAMEGGDNAERARGARDENEQRIRHLRRFAPAGRVLDFGCSTGVLAMQLRAAGYEVEGADLSPYACERARALLPGMPVHCGSIGDHLGALRRRFDAVTMMDVIEHLPDVAGTLGHLRELLRPGGLLFLRTPTMRSPFYRVAEWSYRLSGGRYRQALLRAYHAEHLVFFDEASIVSTLGEFGFDVIEISPDPLLWRNFRAAEMRGGWLQNTALAAVYFLGRLAGRGHGMRVVARRREE